MASTEIQRLTLRLLSAEGRALLNRMRMNISRTSKIAHDLSNTLIAAETMATYGDVEGIEYEPLVTKLVRELLECSEEFGRGSVKPWAG
jgi:hypothetical protein